MGTYAKGCLMIKLNRIRCHVVLILKVFTQVQNKRAQERDQKVNQARKIEPAGASKENVSGSGRLSRKDRLEAYRLEKLAAQEKIKARQVVPFRAGVYHPEKKIKPLPALPRTRAAARTALDRKTKVVPTKPRSSRTTPAPTSARRKRKVSTPRSGTQLLSSYKNQSPKSFAPKNFKFTLNMELPPAKPEEAAVPLPSPVRRSRRISGVQPDLSLTPHQLSVTPARRAKERSVSKERRAKTPWTPEPASSTVSHPVSLPALQEEAGEDKTEAAVTPVKEKEETVRTPAASTARRRRTRHSSIKVIAETNAEQDVVTPVSQLITGISRTNIETEGKAEAFKTPKSSRAKKKVGMTMQVESPLSAVSTVRGSSKRKRTSPETVNSVTALFEGLEGSPLLAKLEAKLSNNEEITENDFDQPPAPKLIKIDLDFDKIADEKEEQKQVSEPDHDVPYFRNLLTSETDRLTGLCEVWETKLEQNSNRVEEEVQGEIRSVIGQARLVMAERFSQFSGLVDNCEFKSGEKETTTTDLTGFWEMIYFQVVDVDKKFEKLRAIEENDWKEVVPKPIVKKKLAKKPVKSTQQKSASSGLKAMIAAKRKAAADVKAMEGSEGSSQNKPLSLREMMAQKRAEMAKGKKDEEKKESLSGDNLFDGGFFQVTSPARNSLKSSPKPDSPKTATPRTAAGDKLRRSVLDETNRRRSVSGLLLSPFISAVARRSLTTDSSPSPLRPAAGPKEDTATTPSRTPARRSSRVRTPLNK